MKKSSRTRKRVKIRKVWTIDPRTKVKKSAKVYRRRRNKKKLHDLLKDYL